MSAFLWETSLYLIRHGEAVSNVEPIIGGMEGDTGLTVRGVDQCERLRDRLRETGELRADVFISSTLPRTRQTAEIIAPAISRPILWDAEVQEMRPGDADGMTIAQLKETYGLPDWDRDPAGVIAPNGESWVTFMGRVARSLERIAREQRGKRVVVVCHGGVIDGSILHFMGLPVVPKPLVQFDTHNTSITHWQQRQREGDPSPRWRLIGYNDYAHLREDPPISPIDWDEDAARKATRLP